MPFKCLFQSEAESEMMVTAICQLNFDSTPVKADDIMSIVTSNTKRNLFPEPGKESGPSIVDHTSKRKTMLANRRRGKDEITVTVRKRNESSDDAKTAVNILAENDDMIADGSRGYVLPTVTGKHHDLKSITPTTLADVINGEYNDVINSYRIIDCRYPYEYEGGHVRGAENRYLHETILPLLQQPTFDRQVIIFHCEFSSERGPKMLRFLRSKDRELNKENYPTLNFPEIYLLDGGYKAFFNEHPQLCDPISYRPMLHFEHSADLRHFRTKSKSWTAGEKRRFSRKAMRF